MGRGHGSRLVPGRSVRNALAPVRLAFPPLFFSSIPKRAIGFSYPSGREGRVLGFSLLVATFSIGFLLSRTMVGLPASLVMAWLTGGTAGLMLYNSTRGRIAFLKSYCSTCRLRPSSRSTS